MTTYGTISPRHALRLGAAASALPLVHIRTAGAAGKLKVAFWDHWVPSGNEIMRKQVDAWAEKNKVAVEPDFITGNNLRLQTTGVAEAQARSGHDMFTFLNWDVFNSSSSLAPVDDLMQHLIEKNGAVNTAAEYLARQKGHWIAVPTSSGTQTKPPCGRISWFRKHGLDLMAMYPAKPEHTALSDGWTYDALLKYAELAKKDGLTFAMGLGGNNKYRRHRSGRGHVQGLWGAADRPGG
ncbi:MAG: ABC transporter substrate-binding protein, partial [Pseudomonadota bacterium]|nr:ABC transporter substrate-binding protein [Pseudomonadota bacterium]